MAIPASFETRSAEALMCLPCDSTELTKTGRVVVALAAVLSCLPALASAQASMPSVVRRQLEMEARRYQQHGYTLAHPIIEGDLNDRVRKTIHIALEGGRTYGIAGACDQDCTEIYMQVADEAGHVLDSVSELEERTCSSTPLVPRNTPSSSRCDA